MTLYIRDGRAPIPMKESTSRLMRSNKAKDTQPEVRFRKALWKAGLKGYRLHSKKLPGRPDIIFKKHKVAIFINGCFWHRCPTCDLPLPRSNIAFWKGKFEANVQRDLKKTRSLKKIGWRTITIWECKIKDYLPRCVNRIEHALNNGVKGK